MSQPSDFNKKIEKPRALTWGLERRLQFIDFRLRWEGRINRTDLTEHFGLSIPQASLDIAKYSELAPNNLQYDKSSKTYTATNCFTPHYQRSSAQRYLAELLATKAEVIDSADSFIGTAPEMDCALPPSRTIDEGTVETIVKAIRENISVNVVYQSMTSVEPSERVLSPHALGNDGFRWHVRAYCHKRERFSDFVLARILEVQEYKPSDIQSTDDIAWHTIVTLLLAPNPVLSPAQQRVIELDYGMKEGASPLQCRHALLYYTLRRLGLHHPDSESQISQQIVLTNRDEIQPFIDSLGS